MERVVEFKAELRATSGRLAWAAEDKIVEALYEGAPLIRRAPRYSVMVLVVFERVVLDDSEPTGSTAQYPPRPPGPCLELQLS